MLKKSHSQFITTIYFRCHFQKMWLFWPT